VASRAAAREPGSGRFLGPLPARIPTARRHRAVGQTRGSLPRRRGPVDDAPAAPGTAAGGTRRRRGACLRETRGVNDRDRPGRCVEPTSPRRGGVRWRRGGPVRAEDQPGSRRRRSAGPRSGEVRRGLDGEEAPVGALAGHAEQAEPEQGAPPVVQRALAFAGDRLELERRRTVTCFSTGKKRIGDRPVDGGGVEQPVFRLKIGVASPAPRAGSGSPRSPAGGRRRAPGARPRPSRRPRPAGALVSSTVISNPARGWWCPNRNRIRRWPPGCRRSRSTGAGRPRPPLPRAHPRVAGWTGRSRRARVA
jgi:hypothetical protein